MSSDEIETRITEARDALLKSGNPGTYLLDEEAEALQAALAEVPDTDPLIPLVPTFELLEGTNYIMVRRAGAYVLYGQAEAALKDKTLGQRAQQFAEDLKSFPGLSLPNELVEIYNKIIDEARATGTDDPFVTGDMKATAADSGYASLPAVYAQGTLEGCAVALGLPEEEEEEGEEGEEEVGEGAPDDPDAG